MLPHAHLIIAAITIAPVAFTLFGGYQLVILWVIVGGLTTLLMDLNAFTLVLVFARSHERLRPYCNPFRIYRDFTGFLTTMARYPLALKLLPGLKTSLSQTSRQ